MSQNSLLQASRPARIALSIFIDLLLLGVSSVLFALSFPSFLSEWGWFPLAFFSLVPLFIVVHRSSWVTIWFYGILYGFVCYALFNFWLRTFHPLAHTIVPTIYASYFLAVLPVMKLADALFPRWGYVVQCVLWICYEYLRTQGFLAYSYGILGYSQYLFLPLIQIASLTGVWGVSLLVVFPSAFLGNALKSGLSEAGRRNFSSFVSSNRIVLLVYGALFLGAVVYGAASRVDYERDPRWKVALVQQNVDPWKGGNKAYEKSLRILLRLSTEALKEEPDIVIWSETSFVPAIDWHTRYRTNTDAYLLVKELREYLRDQPVPFVVGNDDGQLVRNEKGIETRVDYNATVLFENGEISDTYRKLHLVPFTEYFPYQRIAPRIYDWLRNADTHFWEKGTEYTVFEAGGVRFSTPICFEDTFGYLCRGFVRNGAEVIVNMTNDWWSQSVAAEMQHMNMAVLRAVENRRTVVRSTNGGITCTIDPNGAIIDIIEPFVENYCISSVPVHTGRSTLYTRWGDWFAVAMLFVGAGCFLFRGVVWLKRWRSAETLER